MALLFPWATKEYLLWNMTIGQIVMYHNHAMDIKNGTKPKTLANKSASELKKMRDDILKDVADVETKARKVEEMRQKYGAIDG
jgi:signal transduction histidine kinase